MNVYVLIFLTLQKAKTYQVYDAINNKERRRKTKIFHLVIK